MDAMGLHLLAFSFVGRFETHGKVGTKSYQAPSVCHRLGHHTSLSTSPLYKQSLFLSLVPLASQDGRC